MTPAIQTFLDELLSIRQDAPGVAAELTDEQFNWRPSPRQWSMAECFDHLNIIGEAYLPALDAAIAKGGARGLTTQDPFAYGWLERLFVRGMEPPVRRRFRSPAKFRPAGRHSRERVMERFAALQQAIGERLQCADGLDLRRIRVRSQAAPIRFTLGATFGIVLAHERRHIWQARQVRRPCACLR